MKAIDKRSNVEVTVETNDNGFIVTQADGTTKNISSASLKRWYKVVDENGNEIAPPTVAAPVINQEDADLKAAKEAEKAQAKADKEAKKAAEKAAKDAQKAAKDAEKAEAKAAREAAKAAKEADKVVVEEVPSPVAITFISEQEVTSEKAAKTRTFIVKVAVDNFVFEMTDVKNSNGRFTVKCNIQEGETVSYISPKSSAKDCINWLRQGYGASWTDEQVAAINREVRLCRKVNLRPAVAETPEQPADTSLTA